MSALSTTPAEFALLNDFQRGFPLCERPFAAVAARVGRSEGWAISTLARFVASGAVSRVGAVFAPGSIGSGTLAALAVPEEQLHAVAEDVNSFPEVNHNYEREHAFNLWFVVTASDAAHLAGTLQAIERVTQCGPLLRLPLVEEYRIDLGFDLGPGVGSVTTMQSAPPMVLSPLLLSEGECKLVAALELGLALTPRPFEALAARACSTESSVLQRLQAWTERGVIRRFGVVVRHRELGFAANAMTVWDVPDDAATVCGRRLAQQPGVTLAYRRSRALPHWPYNLFCMIHGRDRNTVLARIQEVSAACGLETFPRAVLFSRTRFKQRGAHYLSGRLAATT
jgi:siroheme decarboxylase